MPALGLHTDNGVSARAPNCTSDAEAAGNLCRAFVFTKSPQSVLSQSISVVNLTQLLSALIALRPPAASAVVHLLNMEEALVLLVQLTAFLLYAWGSFDKHLEMDSLF